MLNRWQMITVYSAAHFVVDFSCAFLMFRTISQSPDWYICLLVYNFCAFAMQMPIGIIADKLNRNHLVACAGCLLVASGYGLTSLPLAATIAIGLGNGMFHIGGGIDILNISGKKCSALGIFVSPGAFGVYFGTILGRGNASVAPLNLLILLTVAGLILAVRRIWGDAYITNAPFSPEASLSGRMVTESRSRLASIAPMLVVATCFFLVVCLRSFVGLSVNFPWRGAGYWGLALVCASAFGKTAGGFLSDRFGTVSTAVCTLGLSALLFLIPQIPAAGVAAILLFNMTMPITLWGTAKLFPGAKGFSFGMLTFALFLGFLPVHLGVSSPPFWLFAVLAAASLALLYTGLRRAKL